MRRGAIDFTLQKGANAISAAGTSADKGMPDKYSFFYRHDEKKGRFVEAACFTLFERG